MRASRKSGVPTARAYSTLPPRIPEDATVDHASGPHVAKIYSDYQPGMLNAETGEELLDEDGLPVTQNSRYISRSPEPNNNTVYMTQSDWTLERQGKGVGRSQSNVEQTGYLKRAQSSERNNQQASAVQRSGSSAAAVGGKLGASASDAQLFAYKRQGGPSKKAPTSPGVDIIRPGIAKPVNVDKAGQKVGQKSSTHFIAPQADINAVESGRESQRMKPKRVAPPPPTTPPYSGPASTSISRSSSSRISSMHDEPDEPVVAPAPVRAPTPPPTPPPLPPPSTADPVVMRPKPADTNGIAATSSTRYSSPPDDPNALYAIPSRVRSSVLSQGSDKPTIPEDRPVLDSEPEAVPAPKPIAPSPPSSPIPIPPPPPPLPASARPAPPNPNQMTVQAVIEPSPPRSPPSPPRSNPTSRRSRGRSIMSAEFNTRGKDECNFIIGVSQFIT